MKLHYRYLLLLGALALLGASCQFQPLEPKDDSTSNDQATIERLQAENDRLKDENKSLEDDIKKMETKQQKEKTEDQEQSETKATEEFTFNEREGGVQKIQDLALKPTDESIVILLSANLEDYEGNDGYAGFGCKDVLVPVEVELEKEMSDLAHAIVELLTTKKDAYSEQGLENSVAGIGLTLENVKYEEGTRIIEFAGDEVKLSGVCSDARILAQIEETIKIYDEEFEVRLNGSASEWKSLFELNSFGGLE